MTISVGADKSLVSGKILSGIFHTKFLCLLSGQTIFFLIFRIKADDVVMRLNLIKRLIFMKESVNFPLKKEKFPTLFPFFFTLGFDVFGPFGGFAHEYFVFPPFSYQLRR